MRTRITTDDSGFTLLEVVIAMVIFTVFCAVSLGLLVRTTDVTKGNLQRTAATNLAAEQIQIARSTSAINILTGASPVRTETVGNTVYTINQFAKYLSADSTTSVCDGASAALAYKLVTVTVTWDDMGSIKPVRVDTLKAFGVGSDGLGTSGALAIGVSGADGTARGGLTVTLNTGASSVSDDDGCTIFVGLTAGTYTATINTVGYVGSANTQSNTKTGLGVTVGNLTRVAFSYDTIRNIAVKVDSPVTGGVVATNLPIRMSTTTLPETDFPACPSAAATPIAACSTPATTAANGAVKELYPAIYTLKLGSCVETAPSQVTTDLRPAATNNLVVPVPVGAGTVSVVKALALTTPIANRTVTFTHAAGSGCTSGEAYTITTTNTPVTLLVPYGSWTVSTPIYNSSGQPTSALATANVTLSPTARTSTTTLVVSL
jgi:prepilin-type N-terminal cleavage/methylation domain-containing protein